MISRVMRVIFICNQNQNRSKTAEELFKDSFETKSAGLFCDPPVSKEQVEWADTICVMEDHQRSKLAQIFPELYLKKRIISLDIPDIFHYNQPELIEILKSRVSGLF